MIHLLMLTICTTHTVVMAIVVVPAVKVEVMVVEADGVNVVIPEVLVVKIDIVVAVDDVVDDVVDVVVVLLQTSSDIITINVTQYSSDCICSLINTKTLSSTTRFTNTGSYLV